jgi:hypothetical protein
VIVVESMQENTCATHCAAAQPKIEGVGAVLTFARSLLTGLDGSTNEVIP